MKATQCTVENCDHEHYARGVCNAHYLQMRKSGELEVLPTIPIADRLMAGLVRMPNGCLEWTGYKVHGYGSIKVNGKMVATHRLAWELVNGPIPGGMFVCHTCDNPPCAAIGHLWLGTPGDNSADMVAKERQGRAESAVTHCPRGHAYDEANTYVNPAGSRACRACGAAHARRYRSQKGAS